LTSPENFTLDVVGSVMAEISLKVLHKSFSSVD